MMLLFWWGEKKNVEIISKRVNHGKILHSLFCPYFEQNGFFFTYLNWRRSEDTKSNVNIRLVFFLYFVAFETFLLCLCWSSLVGEETKWKTLFSPYSSAYHVYWFKNTAIEGKVKTVQASHARNIFQFLAWPIKMSFGEQDVGGRMINCLNLLRFCRRRNHWAWKKGKSWVCSSRTVSPSCTLWHFRAAGFSCTEVFFGISRFLVLSKLWLVR